MARPQICAGRAKYRGQAGLRSGVLKEREHAYVRTVAFLRRPRQVEEHPNGARAEVEEAGHEEVVRMRWMLRWLAALFLAAAAVSLVIAVIAWRLGPATGEVIFFERLPLLIAINFAAFIVLTLLAAGYVAVANKWRWVQQLTIGMGGALIALLPAMFLWPDALISDGILRGPFFLAVVALGAAWALVDHVWQRRRAQHR